MMNGTDLFMEQKLELRQTVILSEKMIQSLRILQMNTGDLYDYLEAISLSNPVIEVEYAEGYRRFSDVSRDVITDLYEPAEKRETLKEYLMKQWTAPLSRQEQMIMTYILNSLDDRGYFTEQPKVAAAVLNTTEKSVQTILRQIQELEPAGAAASDLRECLLIQARRNHSDEKLQELIAGHLELVARNHVRKIADVLDIDEEEAQELCRMIKQMDPLPGRGFETAGRAETIIPDIVIRKDDGMLKPLLNERYEIHISVNRHYAQMLETADDETKEYLEMKILQTERIRECLEKRNQTLLRICGSVLEHQKDFFETDDAVPARMHIKDTADEIGLHASTVSRAIQDKYLECRKGVFPIRAFFTKGGKGDWSRKSIERRIVEIISDEDPSCPLSDSRICEILSASGISISRRTTAKYRAEMGYKDCEGRRRS